jgi:tol-pal system protein YbgF
MQARRREIRLEHAGVRGATHRRLSAFLQLGCALLLVWVGSGCVTVAEFRKLERQVIDLKRSGRSAPDSRTQLADASADVDRLEAQLRRLNGRLEGVEKVARDALAEARKARMELASRGAGAGMGAGTADGLYPEVGGGGEPSALDPGSGPVDALQGSSDEVAAYRAAYSAWRSNDHVLCIDRFRKFLQTYPSSSYADDSAFWMADCHYKQGDYKNAVLRFDDVVRNYPTGNKAADALFRQGESLLKLGPGFHEAAKRAFERVLKEYPDSRRAQQAHRQLDMLGAG